MDERFLGTWAGENLLNLSWLPNPEHHSEATMTITRRGAFWEAAYTWSHEGTAHEGVLLIGVSGESHKATVAWGDSWHQSPSLMFLRGIRTESGALSVQGSYPAESGPDWGWRITLELPEPDTLEMVMTNLPPDGPEDLAVRATYRRKT